MRILIVDDDADIRETLRMFLEDEHHVVLEAVDGVEAIERARESDSPLIILLDFMMPRIDGMDVLRRAVHDPLLARHAYIIMTALHRPPPADLPKLSQQLQIDRVAKPFDLVQLAQVIAEQIAQLGSNAPPASPPNGRSDAG